MTLELLASHWSFPKQLQLQFKLQVADVSFHLLHLPGNGSRM